MSKMLIPLVLMLFMVSTIFAKPLYNDVRSGVNTLCFKPVNQWGFDLVKAVPCSVGNYNVCVDDLAFLSSTTKVCLSNVISYSKCMGTINMDSIKKVAIDSLPDEQYIFKTLPEYMDTVIGKVYVVKTGINDYRRYNLNDFDWPYFLKLKVLSYEITDSTNGRLDAILKIAWVCNIGGANNLVTPFPVDTFNKPTGLPSKQQNKKNQLIENGVIVIGPGFIVPSEFNMNRTRLQVFDMRGRLAGEIDVAGKTVVDLGKELGIREGVWVVK